MATELTDESGIMRMSLTDPAQHVGERKGRYFDDWPQYRFVCCCGWAGHWKNDTFSASEAFTNHLPKRQEESR